MEEIISSEMYLNMQQRRFQFSVTLMLLTPYHVISIILNAYFVIGFGQLIRVFAHLNNLPLYGRHHLMYRMSHSRVTLAYFLKKRGLLTQH
jgi:hypothetical protein